MHCAGGIRMHADARTVTASRLCNERRRSERLACRWKACVQVPQTTGESSPGYFPSGGHLHASRRQIWSDAVAVL